MLVALLIGLPTGFFGCGGGDGTFIPIGDTGSGDGGGGGNSIPPPSTPTPITAEEIAEHPPYGTDFELYNYGTGMLANDGDEPAIVDTQIVSIPDASLLRLIFEDIQVGEGSFIEVWSPLTHERFVLDQYTATAWANTTPQFPGHVVEIRLHLAPHSDGSYALYGMFYGIVPDDQPPSAKMGDPSTETQCGSTDDRIPSSDARVARLNNGCTVWLEGTNNCAFSAGHCVDPPLPANFPHLVEFNVPLSNASGSLNPSAVRDQYFAVPGTQQFVNTGSGRPDDWAVMRVGMNSFGETPIPAQVAAGFTQAGFGPTGIPYGSPVRITGYGVDGGTANQTQQTHVGPAVGSLFPPWPPPNTGVAYRLGYSADTEGGNSGSPVIDDTTGNATGIHTNGGCGAADWPTTFNTGSGIDYPPIQAAYTTTCGKASPSISGCPGDQTVSCNTNNGSEQTFTVNVTDPDGEIILVEFRVDGVLEYSQTVASGSNVSFTHTYSSLGTGGPYVTVATATNATGCQTSCTWDVTVIDNPPTITCPGDITVECTGTSGASVVFAATAIDDCTTNPTITYVPASGSTFPIGTTLVTATATDDNGQTDQCTFNVTVEDTTDPFVSATARRLMLFLPRNGLIDCVLQYSAFDTCDATLDNTVEVYSNQPDTGGAFTPDAGWTGTALEIRAEVDLTVPDPGRVFLIVVRSTDDAGNTGIRCTWVIVPKTATSQDVVGARNIAVAADADCEAGGILPPAGWFTLMPPTTIP
jgi:hypothetical protein